MTTDIEHLPDDAIKFRAVVKEGAHLPRVGDSIVHEHRVYRVTDVIHKVSNQSGDALIFLGAPTVIAQLDLGVRA